MSWSPTSPAAYRASLSTRIFHNVFTTSPSVFSSTVFTLILTGLHPPNTSLSLHSLVVDLSRLRNLTALALSDISLPIESSKPPLTRRLPLSALALKDLSAETIAEFWRLTRAGRGAHLDRLQITRCALPAVVLDVRYLRLSDLGAAVDPRVLSVEGSTITILEVCRCPSLVDAVPHAIMAGAPVFARIGSLRLTDSPGVSSRTVLALMRERMAGDLMSYVAVRGCGPLAAKDREWMDMHPDVMARGCMLCWDDGTTVYRAG